MTVPADETKEEVVGGDKKDDELTEAFIDDADEKAKEAAEKLDEDTDETEDDVVFEVIDGKWVTEIEGVGEIGFRHLTRGEVNRADLFFVKKVNEFKKDGITSIDDIDVNFNPSDLEDIDVDSIVDAMPEGEEVTKESVEKVSNAIAQKMGLMRKMDAMGRTAESLASSERINMWMQCCTFVRAKNEEDETEVWEKKWKNIEALENESTETFNPIMTAYLKFRARTVGFTSG